jgi:hypothetical protein
MTQNKVTRLKPAPLAFPNGGGLAAMATKTNKIKEQELRVAEEQHRLKIAQINEKHKPKPATKAVSRGK